MTRSKGPIGYFVHHQGRGHAERAAAIANAIDPARGVTLFCNRDDIFPVLGEHISICKIPSLFEAVPGDAVALDNYSVPDTLHCAPLGWPSITDAIGAIAEWFARAKPALFITDVSAELGQLARIASVPHVAVLQHGDRSDPGHMAAYQGAVGLLAPYAQTLEQPERPAWMQQKTIYAPGIGINAAKICAKQDARSRLGLGDDLNIVLVVGGGGGAGLPSAPVTVGARSDRASQWITLGTMQTEWHETAPANLQHLGWVNNPEDWICAADKVVSSCGNTTVHMIAAAGKPWIVVPEWRYFAEQICKAEALDRAGIAAVARTWPASASDWARLWQAANAVDTEAQTALIAPNVAETTAKALEALIAKVWSQPTDLIQHGTARA